MSSNQRAFEGCRTSDSETPLPYWRNSLKDPVIREYGFNTAAVEVDGDELRLRVVRTPWKVLIVFSCLFPVIFVFVIWQFIPNPSIRWPVMIGGIFALGLAVALMMGLQHYHESLGDFLVIDRSAKTMMLPRSKTQFPLEEVIGFQWIRGRTKSSGRIRVDLNLLVNESGEIIRHHIMCYPSRQLVEQVTTFSGVRLEQLDLGRRRYRDAEKPGDST